MTMISVILILLLSVVESAVNQQEHRFYWISNNYTWPPERFVPDTQGWRRIMLQRLAQASTIIDLNDRYQAFHQTIHPAILVQNFTEYGFALAKCPDDLLTALQAGIREGLPSARLEQRHPSIEGPLAPWLIDNRRDLVNRVLYELQPYVETWVQQPLEMHQAYGFRLYRNESRLYMHVDRKHTHVVSFILHIDSSDDAEPWPIFIEDFKGNTHEVILTPGSVLLYESSKCFHGRPRPFRGSWYTSVFAHYFPKYGWKETNHDKEAEYAISPEWDKEPTPSDLPKLEMKATAFAEPDCPDAWCPTQDTIHWDGPAEEGFIVYPDQRKVPFFPQLFEEEDEL